MTRDELIKLAERLTKLRGSILERYPFFGRLLLRMPFGFSECKTAFTDMRRIVFDPEFASRLNGKELCFVMMHELMHCVLKHCVRSRGKLGIAYNIACDIVVNSVILEAMGADEISIDGSPVMHLSPDGKEGREYTAEAIYEMLLKKAPESLLVMQGSLCDSHDSWNGLEDDSLVDGSWDSYIKSAGKSAGSGSGIPGAVERYLSEIYRRPKISWRQILHDYIQNCKCDYSFSRPDRRYSGEIIMPSFAENEDGAKIEDVFFFADTSGSVSDKALSEAFEEMKDAVNQIENMSGTVFFFDSQVSEPHEFESVEDIESLKPIGGGGTSFKKIFEYISDNISEKIPSVIIIITDGYCEFPDESDALGIPVVWLIVDSEVEVPWGECVRIYTDEC